MSEIATVRQQCLPTKVKLDDGARQTWVIQAEKGQSISDAANARFVPWSKAKHFKKGDRLIIEGHDLAWELEIRIRAFDTEGEGIVGRVIRSINYEKAVTIAPSWEGATITEEGHEKFVVRWEGQVRKECTSLALAEDFLSKKKLAGETAA